MLKRVLENNGRGFAMFVNNLPEMQQSLFIRRKYISIAKAFLSNGNELIWSNARSLRNGNMLFPFIGILLVGDHLTGREAPCGNQRGSVS